MKKFQIMMIISFCLFLSCNNATQNELKIGIDLPLTGNVAYYGQSAKKGIELAREQLLATAAFSKISINLIYEDNQGEGKEAAVALTKLISADHVPAVIGGGSSVETMAAAPIAEQNHVVLLSPISSASTISKAGDYIFRSCPSDVSQAHDLADWVKEKNFRNVAVIFVNSSWGTGFKDNFVDHYKSVGGTITTEISSDPGQSDFRTQIALIKNTKSEASVFIVYAKEGGALVRQSKELGLNLPIFGGDPWSQQDFLTGAGKSADSVLFTTPAQFDGESFNRFRVAFMQKYHEEPDVYASNGYDCLMILAKGYSESATSGEGLKNFLYHLSNFQGATGTTNFDANGDVIGKKFGRFIVIGGKSNQIK